MAIRIELRSYQHFTTTGERDGSFVAALAAEETQDLQLAYRQQRCSGDWSNPVFGGMARRWESAIADELLRRGIESFQYEDFFGPSTVEVIGSGQFAGVSACVS